MTRTTAVGCTVLADGICSRAGLKSGAVFGMFVRLLVLAIQNYCWSVTDVCSLGGLDQHQQLATNHLSSKQVVICFEGKKY
jgi:hypothetical protein